MTDITSDQTGTIITPMSRDDIRAAIFGAKPQVETATFFGAPIELHEPSTSDVLDFQQSENRKQAVAMMLINYVYVPGTSTPVFEAADVDSILALPFGKDMQQLQTKILALLGVSPSTADKSPIPEE